MRLLFLRDLERFGGGELEVSLGLRTWSPIHALFSAEGRNEEWRKWSRGDGDEPTRYTQYLLSSETLITEIWKDVGQFCTAACQLQHTKLPLNISSWSRSITTIIFKTNYPPIHPSSHLLKLRKPTFANPTNAQMIGHNLYEKPSTCNKTEGEGTEERNFLVTNSYRVVF